MDMLRRILEEEYLQNGHVLHLSFEYYISKILNNTKSI